MRTAHDPLVKAVREVRRQSAHLCRDRDEHGRREPVVVVEAFIHQRADLLGCIRVQRLAVGEIKIRDFGAFAYKRLVGVGSVV
jgi:hypothetical protein